MRTALPLILIALLSGCGSIATNHVSEADAKRVPAERLLALQQPGDNLVRFSVTRESGFQGGGCYVGLEIDRMLVARFDTSEIAWFHVSPGPHEFAVTRDPQGRGLCGLDDMTPSRETLRIEPGKANRFAITFRVFRRPEVEPY